MVDPLQVAFPKLGAYRITSPRSEKYNCIAWAIGETTKWWWPEDGPDIFWPPDIQKEETVSAFLALFTLFGFSTCSTANPENGFEKIALFADTLSQPTHAARQLAGDRWTSKLGRSEDIEHALPELEGEEYGKVVLVMRRPIEPDKNPPNV